VPFRVAVGSGNRLLQRVGFDRLRDAVVLRLLQSPDVDGEQDVGGAVLTLGA
jgi:hypothetical protein